MIDRRFRDTARMMSALRWWIIGLIVAGLMGCEYLRPTLNAPLERWDLHYGYRHTNFPQSPDGSSDSLFLLASFSGGGMRASALAYGALQELARTPIAWEGRHERLLDEMSIVTALSGGSFTAAYYALYGDRIFEDFEPRFLRRDWERSSKGAYSGRRTIGSVCCPHTSAAVTSWPNSSMKHI